jgi:hypothetical protein
MTAIVVCAVLILAWFALYAVFTRRPDGRHARPHEGRHELADPADITDPDGEQYIAQLRTEGRFPYCWDEDETDAGWWAQQAPRGLVEITGPAEQLARTSALTATVLTRVHDSLTALTTTPAGDDHDPDIDDTGRQPIAVCTWGKTAPELADELAAKYLTAEVPQ